MPEFRYAKGRIMDSLSYITKEMDEFESDYASKRWQDMQEIQNYKNYI